MPVPVAEIKLGMDIVSRLLKFFKSKSTVKKEKDIISNIYKELLLGEKADQSKIESLILQLEKAGSVERDFLRAKDLFSETSGSFAFVKRSAGTVATKKVVKRAARKTVTSKKSKTTACKKETRQKKNKMKCEQ